MTSNNPSFTGFGFEFSDEHAALPIEYESVLVLRIMACGQCHIARDKGYWTLEQPGWPSIPIRDAVGEVLLGDGFVESRAAGKEAVYTVKSEKFLRDDLRMPWFYRRHESTAICRGPETQDKV